MSAPTNGCGGCGHDFASLEVFDRHRVGVHTYTYSEGLKMEPMRDDGRRCLAADEMAERGWRQDAKGRWTDPKRARRAARRFQDAT